MGRDADRQLHQPDNGESKFQWRSPRPQFHYFYGSTTAPTTVTTATTMASRSDVTTKPRMRNQYQLAEDDSNQQEQDSLVGEELVSTDNEADMLPAEYQHLLGSEVPTGGAKKQNGHHGTGRNSSNGNTNNTNTDGRNSGYYVLCYILVFVLIAGAMSTLVVLLIPHSSDPLPQRQTFTVPYKSVVRADFGDPPEEFLNVDLFHPTLIASTQVANQETFIFPFPTGAFWTNLVVLSPMGDISYPIVVYPYAYRWSSNSLEVSYPGRHRITDAHAITDAFAPDLTLMTVEEISKRHVTAFDPLSVTLRFASSVNSKWETALVQGSPYVTSQYVKETPILKPLSIFSMVQCPGDDEENFSDFAPNEGTSSVKPGDFAGSRRQLYGVCSLDDSDSKVTTLRGVQFIFKTPEAVNWIMFASEPMNLVFDKLQKTTITSASPFTGVIRLAYIPNDRRDQKTFDSSTGLRRLIYHAGEYPVGGKVSFEFHQVTPTLSSSSTKSPAKGSSNIDPIMDANRRAAVSFSFTTRNMMTATVTPSSSTSNLLMLALPHHAQLLSPAVMLDSQKFDLRYRCIKGNLTPVIGGTWSYEEPLFDIEFDSPTQILEPAIRDLILKQLDEDLDGVLPTYSENVYGYGKQVARLAQLAHVANVLGNRGDDQRNTATAASTLLDKASEQLSTHLEAYLSSNVGDSLLFDSNLGGLLSSNGLLNNGEDFGNGRYNDHHFHYGYFLYAAAVMGRIDSTFIDRFGTHVDAIFHDVAHSSSGDSRAVTAGELFFPMARHKSWFDGHSFATGMFPFGNGKSQESSSEAVNCYYGAYLWSLVRNQEQSSDMTDFARLLLAMEIRGAKTYWHMLPPSVTGNSTTDSTLHLYTPEFEENYMIGNVGMLDVAANTWFGMDPLYVHMINAIPITAVTGILFEPKYVQFEYPFLMKSLSSVEMAWRGYTTSIHSIIDPNDAWMEAQSLVSFELDAAVSKTQVLYFISQRPGFNVTYDDSSANKPNRASGKSSPAQSALASTDSSSLSSSCDAHPRCGSLLGECCPTDEGVSLDCCNV